MKGKIYRFAEFELRPAESELRKGDSSIKLQEKPLRLLTALLDHPQNLVTRDQLRKQMWDSETFVDYEQGINVAVKKVRDALGDSAENPRLIETVAKRGYRMLAPVDVVATEGEPWPARSTPAAPTEADPAPRQLARMRRGWVMLAATVIMGIALGTRFFPSRGAERHAKPISSLAVLPLRNLSPDPGQDYFADGITEELITDLAQSLPLRVISRTSVMRYRQTSEPVTQIALDLGVEAIVEGAVARSGDRVTVTVQLIDATEDRHLWAKEFDRKVEDILAIEADLSQEIASQVGNALALDHRLRPASTHPVDTEVYDLCLLGRYFWNKRTTAGLAKSLEYFQQAIRRDPNYAPAYAGLADSYVILPSYNSVDLEDNFRKADAAAGRAIELDETLADAHTARAFVALNYWKTRSKEAEREFHRSLELNPNYATAHHWFAFYLVLAGEMNEAIAEIERARRLDPLSPIINADTGQMLYASGQNEQAKARLHQAIELMPELGQPHETLAFIDLAEQRTSDALEEARKGLKLDSSNPRTIAEAGYVLAVTGHADEARNLLRNLNELVRRHSAFPMLPALIWLGLGEQDRALNVLSEVETVKIGAGLRGLIQWPVFDQLKTNPRYQQLIVAERQ